MENTGLGFKAKLKFYHCKSSYDCISASERMPSMRCFSNELLPGKAEIDPDKCTGCGECICACSNNAIEMVAV